MLTPKAPLSAIGGRHSIHGSLELPFKSTAFENHTTTTRIRDISHSFIKKRRAQRAHNSSSAPTSVRNSPRPIDRRKTTGPGNQQTPKGGTTKSLKYLKKELVQWFSKESKPLTPVAVPSQSSYRSSWKPSLATIYGDPDLLDALERFMTKQYNAENIQFLRTARRLNAMIDDTMNQSPLMPRNRFEEQKIDSAIVSLYRSFIAEDTAQQQINLKYAVKTRINDIFKIKSNKKKNDDDTKKKKKATKAMKASSLEALSRFTLQQKRHIFDECIAEIEQLVRTSVLYSFYASPEFQDIAQDRDIPTESSSYADVHCNDLIKAKSAPPGRRPHDIRELLRMVDSPVPVASAMDAEFHPYRRLSFHFADFADSTPHSTISGLSRTSRNSIHSGIGSKTSQTTATNGTMVIPLAGCPGMTGTGSAVSSATTTPMNRSCLSSPYSSMSPRLSVSPTPCSRLSLPQSDTRLSVDISRDEFAEDCRFIERYQPTPYQSQLDGDLDCDDLALLDTSTSADAEEEDSFPFDDEKERNMQLTSRWILQPFESVMDDHVHFGNVVLAQNGRHHIFDSQGMTQGVHEWEVQILQMDRHVLQEIGVVSTQYIQSTVIHDNGASVKKKKAKQRGARAVIGHQSRLDDEELAFMYYGSWNGDGKRRCYRDLSTKQYRRGWKAGDILKVKLDLKHYKIRFFLNDEKVRSSLSLQPGKVYHPFISFTGNCQYKLLNVFNV